MSFTITSNHQGFSFTDKFALTDICNIIVYVVAIPYAPNAYINHALGEKAAFICCWLIIVLLFSFLRYTVSDRQTFSAYFIDTIARSLGVSVGNISAMEPTGYHQWNCSRSLLLAALTVFAIVFGSYYSSYLFTQYMVDVRGIKRIHHYEELFNDTLMLTVPVNVYLSTVPEVRLL